MKRTTFFAALLLSALLLAAAGPAPASDPANALLVVPSGTAFNRKFQNFLDKHGAKLLHSHPPNVFIGYIPPSLDAELREDFGAEVYREQVEDWTSFARYGENAIYAVNAWNKRFLDTPPEAPLVVSARVQKAGRGGEGINLVWNGVMKANAYRLQISRDKEFSDIDLETVVARNRYAFYPSFLPDGVYYWRVAGLLTLNTGETHQGSYSEPYSFAASRPSSGKGRPAAPKVAEKLKVTSGHISWPAAEGAKYYRLQISAKPDFKIPLLDVFTDNPGYKTSGLPMKRDAVYYMRVMPSDGAEAGAWSLPSEVVVESPKPIRSDMRRIRRKKK